MSDTAWLRALSQLRASRTAAVLVTVTDVRGHAPREAGAKMVVTATDSFGSIGGGNLEAMALDEARAMLAEGASVPRTSVETLSDKQPYRYGVQCCGGSVSTLFEPIPAVAAVAVFGVGHVGLELARVLARHDLELHLVDTRTERLAADRLRVLDDAVATVHVHQLAVMPEIALGELPPDTHVLIMTHDHAEDLALCDAVLRAGRFASIGLIGSASKWSRFRMRLAEAGHDEAAIARIHCPIGRAEITGKDPATIAVSVAADLLTRFAAESRTVEAESRTAEAEFRYRPGTGAAGSAPARTGSEPPP